MLIRKVSQAIILAAILAPSIACADELDDIQRARETAEMQYVNELGSGKYKTAQEREALKKRLLEPHQQKTKEYFKSISVMPTPRSIRAEDIDLKSGPKQDLSSLANEKQNSSSTTGGRAVSPSQGGVPSSEKRQLRPEYELDGSNVPKELVFGVPNFESPSVTTTPSPTPSSHQTSKKP